MAIPENAYLNQQSITLVHQFFRFPEEPGIQRPFRIATALSGLDWNVRVISSLPPSANLSRQNARAVESSQMLSVTRFPHRYSQEMGEWSRIWSYLGFGLRTIMQALANPTDVVYASSGPLSVIFPAIAMKLVKKTKVILEIRDEWPRVAIALGFLKNPIARFLASLLEKVSLNIADTIIVASPDMVTRTREKLFQSKPIHVVTNIADSSAHQPSLPVNLDLLLPEKFLIYAGSFGRSNGTEYLLEIASRLRDVSSDLAVVAVGEGQYWQETKSRAQKSGLLGKSYFQFGSLPADVRSQLIQQSRGCLSTFAPVEELSANSANKFFDALAAGKPVVINYNGWQAKIVKEWKIGLVLPSDPGQIDPEKIVSYFDDSAGLETAATNSKALGEQFFSIPVVSDHLNMILTQLVGQTNQTSWNNPCDHIMCHLATG